MSKSDTESLFSQVMTSPIGKLTLIADKQYLREIRFGDDDCATIPHSNAVLDRTRQQLQEYFAGQRRHFDLPLKPQGTNFQQQVWKALLAVDFGELASYQDIARIIDNPKAVRAVGAANGRNPIPIIIPCHRIIGSDGKLTGYAGGLRIKQQLLRLEDAGAKGSLL